MLALAFGWFSLQSLQCLGTHSYWEPTSRPTEALFGMLGINKTAELLEKAFLLKNGARESVRNK